MSAMPRATAHRPPGARDCGGPPARRMHRSGSWLGARALFAERRLSGVRYLDPLLVGRGIRHIAVVPVPPLVGRGLGIAFGRVFPDLLPAERRDVEVVPGAA